MVASWISSKAAKGRPSDIAGRGLVAVAPIARDEVVAVALTDVAVGEELTTDYALFDDYDGEMPCGCGTPSCRQVIDGRDWQRPDLQARHAPYFSWYLRRRFADR